MSLQFKNITLKKKKLFLELDRKKLSYSNFNFIDERSKLINELRVKNKVPTHLYRVASHQVIILSSIITL